MMLAALQAVLRPTAPCIYRPSDAQLEQAEQAIGTALPPDYKEFVQAYGMGSVAGFLGVLNPISPSRWGNLVYRAMQDTEGLRELKDSFPDLFHHSRYPEPGGLLPWGGTNNGDMLYWLTGGQPRDWPVVVYESRSADYAVLSTSVTSFLHSLIKGGSETPDISAQRSVGEGRVRRQ